MSYFDISQIAIDGSLRQRVLGCLWNEGVIDESEQWAADHAKDLAVQPGWADAWASARAASKPNIGLDDSVISDGMILAAVQSLRSMEQTPPETGDSNV